MEVEFEMRHCGSINVSVYASPRTVDLGTRGRREHRTPRRVEIWAPRKRQPVLVREFSSGQIGAEHEVSVTYQALASDPKGTWRVRILHDALPSHPAQTFVVDVVHPGDLVIHTVTTASNWWFWEFLRILFKGVTVHVHHGPDASWIRSSLGEERFTASDFDGTGVNDLNSILAPDDSSTPRFQLVPGQSGGAFLITFLFEGDGQEFVATESGGFHGHMSDMRLAVTLPWAGPRARPISRPTEARFTFEMDLANVPESWFDTENRVRDEFETQTVSSLRPIRVELAAQARRAVYQELPPPPLPWPDTIDAKMAYYSIWSSSMASDGRLSIDYYHVPRRPVPEGPIKPLD
jgi:hypothetical protein